MASLPDSVRSLTRAEKFDLLDALWTDLESSSHVVLSAEQDDELDNRIARYEKDQDAVTSWEELKAEIGR